MKIHFIWFGSIPHPDLIAKMAAKMRYLKSMFNQVPNLTIYLWTMPHEMGILTSKFAMEHLNNLNLQIKNIQDLFKQSHGLPAEALLQLDILFLKESTGPISNKAVAADMIKFLTLLYFGGLYVDAGLEVIFNPTNRVEAELLNLSNRGIGLYNELKKYDYALTRRNKTGSDLQIMFFSQNKNAKKFLVDTIDDILALYPNDSGHKYYHSKEYDEYREFKFSYQDNKALNTKSLSYTGDSFFRTNRKSHKIYFFEVISWKNFDDFPEIWIKSQKNQKYENYRTKIFIPQDETGYPSLFFPRKKKP